MLTDRRLSVRGYLFFGSMLVIGVAGAFLIFGGSLTQDNAGTAKPTAEFPQANQNIPPAGTTPVVATTSFATSTVTQAVALDLRSGEAVVIKDFLHNGETVADTVNPGSYVLAGDLGYCTADGVCGANAPTTGFSISYNAPIQFFNITLLQEPIGPARTSAEQFLRSRLGITEQQMCALNYYVGTPYWVNVTYDDRNLGFSFCTGATILPK